MAAGQAGETRIENRHEGLTRNGRSGVSEAIQAEPPSSWVLKARQVAGEGLYTRSTFAAI